MSPIEVALLLAGGVLAGVVNTLAGGGSLLTVPLLVVMGLPGTLANGTNRVGLLLQSLSAVWSFRAHGVFAFRSAAPLIVPATLGSAIGAFAISRVADETFERLFGLMMLLLLVPTLRRTAELRAPAGGSRAWSPALATPVFFAIGLYAGAFQAGTGIALVFALSHAGFDLTRANAIKMVLMVALTLVAVPVFVAEGQVAWAPALVLAAGFSAGGALGARIAVGGGERVIRPVLTLAVLALAGRMFDLY